MTELYSIIPWNHVHHYQMVAEWWMERDREPIPEELIPAYGAIVADGEFLPRAAAWYLYDAVNQQAYLSEFVANPDKPLTLYLAGKLLQAIADLARDQGGVIIWAHVHDERLARGAERLGFTITGQKATLLAGRL